MIKVNRGRIELDGSPYDVLTEWFALTGALTALFVNMGNEPEKVQVMMKNTAADAVENYGSEDLYEQSRKKTVKQSN